MDVSPVLADSSFYIRMMRNRRDPLGALAVTSVTRDLATCGIIRCEVGRAMRLESTQKRYHAFWDSMIQVPTDASLWREVEILLSRLDRSGRIIPLPDAVIACCALRIQATVLTWDEHFREIPGLSTLYPSELI